MARPILLLVQFDGTDFHGWQMQQSLRTVQGVLSKAIQEMLEVAPTLYASSRTDAGVHARGLPVLFYTDKDIPTHGFEKGLNSITPPDVSILQAVEVSDDFNVRTSANGKQYCYRIWNARHAAALQSRYAWHIPYTLDIDAMNEAGQQLVGEFDFSSFRATGCQARSTQRRITKVHASQEHPAEITVTVEGNAFLQHMVRIIVGTLVEIGRGARRVEWMAEALKQRDRTAAGPTTPPHGLCLERVHYDPCPFSPEHWTRTHRPSVDSV